MEKITAMLCTYALSEECIRITANCIELSRPVCPRLRRTTVGIVIDGQLLANAEHVEADTHQMIVIK